MQRRSNMKREHVDVAEAAGRAWADRKLDRLVDVVPAVHWPDYWRREDDEPLPIAEGEVDAVERDALRRIAEHAAAERWRQFLVQQRFEEDAEDEEQDLEVRAAQLLAVLRPSLPAGLRAQQAGERVYLEEVATGREHTVTTLAHAWRVVAEWLEHTSPA